MSKYAIIGISGLFPGSSTSEEFWKNLMEGKDLTSLSNAEDFGADPNLFYDPSKGVVDKCYSLRGGYIRDFQFDASGFKIPANQLSQKDKLYQWSLHVAKESLRESGYLNKEAALEKCGVILGTLSFPTATSHKMMSEIYSETAQKVLQNHLGDSSIQIKPSNFPYHNPNTLDEAPSKIVKKALGLGTTHYSLDAACATSLYAIKLACDELATGKSDMMLAGAVCGSDQLFIHMGFSIFHAYADGNSKFVPLDKDSGGLVSSEGAGMVVLKRLADAERDGDNILAVICGTGLSNDGRGKFLLSPNPEGQKLAFERAYSENNISPSDTSYLECHATGTPLGDTTELNSIADFFKQHDAKPLLGSVKSNMGHLLTAAAMSGLHKVILSMQKGIIPPNINLQKGLNADNDWIGESQMISSPTKWNGANVQAAINSFGFGGTNAHMVVQNYVKGADDSKFTKPQRFSKLNPESRIELLPMSIIGMDIHFGDCDNIDDFYSSIFYGKQHFRELPKERWKGFDENKELLTKFGLKDGKAPKGSYIEDFEIDLLRYKIQPAEAETLEPQQALILKVADNAIQDAGLEEGQNVAVLIAMESEPTIHHYLARWDLEWQLADALNGSNNDKLSSNLRNAVYYRDGAQTPSQHTSFVGNIMASRIAQLWDFSGPAFTVSAGDNSAFKALEIAQNLLSKGEVDAVVVGAVDFAGGLESVLYRNLQSGTNTNEQPSIAFNKSDAGQLIGEGAGAVVLKRSESKTEKTYAIIDEIGEGLNFDGIDYLEINGSGNKAEDEKEIQYLTQNNPNQKIAIGSVKSNFGNTRAASGLASLIKTAICLHYSFLPTVPNWKEPSTDAFYDKNYYFPIYSHPWILNQGKGCRQAMVNGAEGMSLRLSESIYSFENKSEQTFLLKNTPSLFFIKGEGEDELIGKIESLESRILSGEKLKDLSNYFYQDYQENQLTYCLVISATTQSDLLREIRFFKNSIPKSFINLKPLKTPGGSYFTPNPLAEVGEIAFVYPGSATSYSGLNKEVFQLFPQIYAENSESVKDFYRFVFPDYAFPKKIKADDPDPAIHEDVLALMSSGVFCSKVWTYVLDNYLKIQPDLAFGYSMGECSSMIYGAKVWHPDNTLVFQNSPIFTNRFAGKLELLAEHWGITSEEAREKWVGLVLIAPREKVEKLIENQEQVYLTFVNTENEVVISGDRTICYQIAETLGVPSVEIPFQNVIHHDFCKKELNGLLDMHSFKILEKPKYPFFSSMTLDTMELDEKVLAENSTKVCCQTVDFPKTVKAVHDRGVRIFIEVGAAATCSGWINSILDGKEFHVVPVDRKGKSNRQNLFELISQLVSHGVDLDVSFLFPKKEVDKKKKRSFFKKIRPGGKRIFDCLPPDPLKGELNSLNAEEVSYSSFSGEPNMPGIAVLEKPKIQKKTIPTKIKKVIVENTIQKKIAENKLSGSVGELDGLAENGLPIQNFASGEHLVGKDIIFTQEDLKEFAYGSIAKVFGQEYSVIDSYRRRTMLPMDPYLLVSRVTGLKGERGKFEPSTMQTEYDIPHGAWFTTDRQIPWAVSVESGQCDLLLISYLGIDFQAKGDLVYRLLDCTLTFVDDLPFEGQTLRYDISINSFVRNGDNLLFFFSYRCYVHDRLVLKMDGGCAGYFKDDELEAGSGVVYKDSEIEARKNATKRSFVPLLKTEKTAFSKDELRHLINGEPEKCFGDISYYANGRNPSLCLPPEKILMLDRIVSVDLKGGAYGLGYIVAEKNLSPEDWYFPCHFRDDEVLAGSLQAEGGGNLLRFFMLMLGLQRLTKDARYQPIFDLPQKVRCRKQVVPGKDTKLIYKLEIKEIGLTPNPYVIGDLEIISNDIVTVHFENLGLQLREKDNPRYKELAKQNEPKPAPKAMVLNEKDIEEFALGDMTVPFGDAFKIYDGRYSSRQPNTDLHVVTRVVDFQGERNDFSKKASFVAEYDVPENVWYYDSNSTYTMPYSILMEIALQPCGLMGAYMGSTLLFPDKDLFFRNLDGDGEMFDLPTGTDFRGKTITNKAVMTSSVALGGTVLQNYTFECSIDGHVFYKGKSSFGFFPADALASQVGLDKGAEVPSWFQANNLQPKDYMQIKLDSLYGKMKLYKAPVGKPHYRLAEDQLNLIDNLRIVKDGGEHGKGYVHATRFMQPYDWFFTCHFYTDPVMPGSLGVEAMLQAMQVFALQQDLGKDFVSPKFVHLPNHKTDWKYRGQIFQHVENMHLEVHIKSIEKRDGMLAIIGDAFLWNEGMRIYQVTNLALGIEEA